jgi:uncharacterized lipoprotein YajG
MCAARLAFITLIMSLAACSSAPHSVALNPQVAAAQASDKFAGLPIAIHIADARPDKVLGQRGAAADAPKISVDADYSMALRTTLANALQKLGFRTDLAGVEQPRRLRIELRSLRYQPPVNWFGGSARASAILAATAAHRDAGVEKTYTVENGDWYLIAPSDEQIDRLVNATLGEGLQRIVNDDELIRVLAAGAN